MIINQQQIQHRPRPISMAAALVALASIAGLAGCAPPIQDPWVQTAEQLRDERQRSESQANRLRDRLVRIQDAQ